MSARGFPSPQDVGEMDLELQISVNYQRQEWE